MTDEEKIYSDDYADIVALTGDLPDVLFSTDDVFVQYIDRYSVIHIPRPTLAQYGVSPRTYEPFVMGLCREWLADTGISQVLAQSTLNTDGSGVLIGIIDTGIDYEEEIFRYEGGVSRIAACWDQGDRTGRPPDGRIYGTEYSRAQITEAADNAEALPISDRNGHGTRLARIALTAAPQAELVVVKLKQAKEYLINENLFENTVAFQSSDVMTALEYVTDKAAALGRPISVIIGLGTTQGAHNGLSLLEQYVNELSLRTGVCITAAVGNEGLARRHYFSRVSELSRSIELSVENSDGVTLWLWNDYLCRASVGVISPLGETVQPIQPVSQSKSSFNLPLGSGSVSIEYRLPIGEKQLSIITLQTPVSGIWRINLSFSRTWLCSVDAWLPMESFLSGSVTFLSPSTATTAVVPSTAPLILSVGGYNSNTGGIYENTGRGPNTRGVVRPDLTAPAVDIYGFDGTSTAAAITGGAAALLLHWGIVLGNDPAITTDTIKTYLIAGAEQPIRNIETGTEGFPNNIWGYGKLNLFNTFRQIF